MKKVLSAFLFLFFYIATDAQNKKLDLALPQSEDSLIKKSPKGIIIQFNKASFSPFAIKDLLLSINDDFDFNRFVNNDISFNDTTNGFVQTSFLISIFAQTKDHRPVKINNQAGVKIFIPSDSLTDDFHKSLFSGFRNDMGVLEWQYKKEPDEMIKIDSNSYQFYLTEGSSDYLIGKDVGIEPYEAVLKVKGFDHPKVYIIYKKINVMTFARQIKKGTYTIHNNTDPFNTVVIVKGMKNGKNYFTELRLTEIKEGKNIKEYEIGEKYFIELKNPKIKLRLF